MTSSTGLERKQNGACHTVNDTKQGGGGGGCGGVGVGGGGVGGGGVGGGWGTGCGGGGRGGGGGCWAVMAAVGVLQLVNDTLPTATRYRSTKRRYRSATTCNRSTPIRYQSIITRSRSTTKGSPINNDIVSIKSDTLSINSGA